MNKEIAIKIFDAGCLKVMRAVPEKHIINFFGLSVSFSVFISVTNNLNNSYDNLDLV